MFSGHRGIRNSEQCPQTDADDAPFVTEVGEEKKQDANSDNVTLTGEKHENENGSTPISEQPKPRVMHEFITLNYVRIDPDRKSDQKELSDDEKVSLFMPDEISISTDCEVNGEDVTGMHDGFNDINADTAGGCNLALSAYRQYPEVGYSPCLWPTNQYKEENSSSSYGMRERSNSSGRSSLQPPTLSNSFKLRSPTDRKTATLRRTNNCKLDPALRRLQRESQWPRRQGQSINTEEFISKMNNLSETFAQNVHVKEDRKKNCFEHMLKMREDELSDYLHMVPEINVDGVHRLDVSNFDLLMRTKTAEHPNLCKLILNAIDSKPEKKASSSAITEYLISNYHFSMPIKQVAVCVNEALHKMVIFKKLTYGKCDLLFESTAGKNTDTRVIRNMHMSNFATPAVPKMENQTKETNIVIMTRIRKIEKIAEIVKEQSISGKKQPNDRRASTKEKQKKRMERIALTKAKCEQKNARKKPDQKTQHAPKTTNRCESDSTSSHLRMMKNATEQSGLEQNVANKRDDDLQK